MEIKLTQAITYESKLAKKDTVLNVSNALGETLIKNNMAVLSEKNGDAPVESDKENKDAGKQVSNKKGK